VDSCLFGGEPSQNIRTFYSEIVSSALAFLGVALG